MRHVWVADAADRAGVKRPGLLVKWRKGPLGSWEALVLYGAELRSGQWAVVYERETAAPMRAKAYARPRRTDS